jgi:two-component system, NtrC family, nitrogen regulation sensor histidine kinase NtrY
VSLRQKLLLVFSLTVVLAVAAVAWIVSLRTRDAFAAADKKRTAATVDQFRREFSARAQEVASRLKRLASSDRMSRIAFDLAVTNHDASPDLEEAAALAKEYQLDYLEILLPDGTIVSSAQWPARFGYQENVNTFPANVTFLKREELSDGRSDIGLFAIRTVKGSELSLTMLGGNRLNRDFFTNLAVGADTQVLFYPALTPTFDPDALVSTSGPTEQGALYQNVIEQARSSGKDVQSLIYLTDRREDSVDATAIPLKGAGGSALAVLVVANSRRELVELQQHIRAIAYGVAGIGIMLAIAASLWITLRISRPIEQLAAAASEVAAGDWDARVTVSSHDEVGDLAESFNHMTQQLSEQRERLVQSERVAAWRELARRLAHELKNPLFPLQLTVENLIRARNLPPPEFDEIFRESTATLTAEITNLKNVIARFNDFSKMPKPQLQELSISDVTKKVASFYEPTLTQHQPPITLRCKMSHQPTMIMADPDLLHRALSNLVLNAMDAMPNGGEITIESARKNDMAELRVTDTGTGMTAEESERLFTPYYTTKQHGTGLGLAIVQSVVSDHHGTIRAESTPGSGATFIVELPLAAGGAKA